MKAYAVTAAFSFVKHAHASTSLIYTIINLLIFLRSEAPFTSLMMLQNTTKLKLVCGRIEKFKHMLQFHRRSSLT